MQIYQKPESAPNAIAQLYNLKTDPQEENNLIEQYPTLAAELKQLLETYPAIDRLAEAGIKVFGPSQKAAQLESSKGFTKDLCKKHGIPTGAYERFTDADIAGLDVLRADDDGLFLSASRRRRRRPGARHRRQLPHRGRGRCRPGPAWW